MMLIVIFLGGLFAYGLFSRRLERTVLTAPLLFTIVGMLTLSLAPPLQNNRTTLEAFLRVAELGLVLLLFADAARTDLKVLTNIRALPMRLLSIGMLLTILLGAIAAKLVFPQLTLWEAGILSAILAPTDAGLGQVIVTSPRVPMKIRQALNVEAGLNDGLAVPFLLFFIGLAGEDPLARQAGLTKFIVEQLGYGTAIGVAIGLLGGVLFRYARGKEWMAEAFEQLALLALPLLCLLAAEATHASMFIAAFVAGLAVQVAFRKTSPSPQATAALRPGHLTQLRRIHAGQSDAAAKHSLEFTEECGQLLNLAVFFFFGLVVALNWSHFTPALFLYAVLSLTAVRIVPVAISLIGTRLHWSTLLFSGWFGPRGLASIVLGLVYLEQDTGHPGESTIRLAVMTTVLLSIVLHGVSAQPGMKLYSARLKSLGDNIPECDDAVLASQFVATKSVATTT